MSVAKKDHYCVCAIISIAHNPSAIVQLPIITLCSFVIYFLIQDLFNSSQFIALCLFMKNTRNSVTSALPAVTF